MTDLRTMNGLAALKWVVVFFLMAGCFSEQTIIVEHTDYRPPAPVTDEVLVDDTFDPAKAPSFDPNRTDSRDAEGWTVNLSGAVTRLDIEPLKPDVDLELLKLRPSYLQAIQHQTTELNILPSVNLIDGKAKQFDDGLYAAIEEHWFRQKLGAFHGDLDFLERLAKGVAADSKAAAFLAEGLALAGIDVPATDLAARQEFKHAFDIDLLKTKPIGFYAWTDRLQQCYRVGRYFQTDFQFDDVDWLSSIVQAMRSNTELLKDYQQILARWARLSNRPARLTVADLVDLPPDTDLNRLCRDRKISLKLISLIPPGTNRESELTRRVFPLGIPASADIMRELVKAIREGTVNLQPTAASGWYDYQVYALETLLLPQKGAEARHLLLSANYKRRMQEAFQSLMTKRKETHVLRSDTAPKSAAAPRPIQHFVPRLRLEPAPTYYLRMARSYRFLELAIHELVDGTSLSDMYGLTESGRRKYLLTDELLEMQRLFYGCHVLSAEDLGMEHQLAADEQVDIALCRNSAQNWLATFREDGDLAADTRVIVPVAEDTRRRMMSTWATVGVRLARLKASYQPEAAPRVRPAEGGDWIALTPDQIGDASYLIAVDEFVSVQLPSSRIFSRAEFRELCNQCQTREQIIRRLQSEGAQTGEAAAQ